MLMKSKMNQDKFMSLLFFAIPLVVMLYCFGSGINGNDFWWHIKVGEYIVENGSVPRTDIFSWYGMAVGIEWTAHEWLAEVLFFLLFKGFGSIGVFLFSVAAAVLLYCGMWNQAQKYVDRNYLIAGVFFALFGVVTTLFFYGRPHVFGYFLLFAELRILYGFFENQKSRKIYFIPVIAALWSNLHGGSSSLSYIVCLIFLVCGACRFEIGRIQAERMQKSSLVKLGIVTIATIPGILLNPVGGKVLVYPYVNLSDDLSMKLISEWAAPDAKMIGSLVLYFFPILMMTIGIISEEKKIRLIDLALMLTFLFLFFRSVRFIILWYIVAAFYAFRYLPEMKIKAITKTSEKIAVGLLAVFLLVPAGAGVAEMVSTYRNGELISTVMTDEAIEAVKKESPQRIFNDYNLGEALIYHDIPVFFDARADLYAQENIMADGVSLMFLEQANKKAETVYVDVDGMIKKYGFDSILILKGRALYSYIMSHPEDFELIYEDGKIVYYRVI